MLSSRWFLQGPLEVCFVLLSAGESCPVRAKIHRSDFQSLVCNRPSRGKNQPSRPVSFETLSIPHRLFFGHKRHQRHRHCQDRWYKHRWFVFQLCRVQHSSCRLKIQGREMKLMFKQKIKAILNKFVYKYHNDMRKSQLHLLSTHLINIRDYKTSFVRRPR